jgi:hypothetical protein
MAESDTPDVTDATKAEENRDASVHSGADRPPTPDEAAAAERNELDPEVAKNYKEQAERGANVKGEGRV